MDKLRKRAKQIFLVSFLILLLLYMTDILNIDLGWLNYPFILMIPVLFSCVIANLILVLIFKSDLKSKLPALILSLIPVITFVYFFLMLFSIQC